MLASARFVFLNIINDGFRLVYFKFHKGGRMTQNEETIKNDGLETEMDPPEKKKGRPKKVNTEDTTESTLPEDENQTDGISEQEEQVEGNQNTETAEDEHIVGLEEDIEDINDSEEDSVEDSAEDSVEDIEDGEINPTVDEIAKAIATIFDKRRVFAANKKEKRKLYGRKEKVVSERGASAKTEKDYLKEEYEILKAAVRSYPKKLILKGVITGVVEDSTTGQMSAQVKADNTRGLFKILIPVQELFPIRLEDYRGERGVEYLKNEMISRINGEIEFTVYDLHEAERYAKGSRVEALAIKTSRYYFNLQNDGKPEMVAVNLDGESKVISLGTFKTLLETDEAMHQMAALEADFVIILNRFVEKNLDDFTWSGYDLIPLDSNGKRCKNRCGYEIHDKTKIMERVKGMFQGTCEKVCVLNNATKEKTYYVLNEYKEVTESEACKCQKN